MANDRLLLVAATVCFCAAVARTFVAFRARDFRLGRFNFFCILAGFVFQTLFLAVRGHSVGRCPITNLFEVFAFLSWSIALIYVLVGPAYRLSLMGAFTAPLISIIQITALLAPIDMPHQTRVRANSWLEFHASMSMIAYGAFALAFVAGLMYLVQERQLKTRQIGSIFHHLPPLTDLYGAIIRLLWIGFAIYTAGLISGFFTGQPLPRVKMICAFAVWLLYGIILQGPRLFRLTPKHVATLCIVGFSAAVCLLWGITFVSANAAS